MLFTDAQLWDSNTQNAWAPNTIAYQWSAYKKMAPAAKLYVFDLAGYGTAPVRMMGDDVCLIAGWSEKVFAMMEAIENGKDAIMVIENMEI
jgi:LAS superfamily LD-carboxypeptidase LdcB